MKAVQITEAGKVQVADIVKPTLGVGEILLRIKYVVVPTLILTLEEILWSRCLLSRDMKWVL